MKLKAFVPLLQGLPTFLRTKPIASIFSRMAEVPSSTDSAPRGDLHKWEGMWANGIGKGDAFDCGTGCPALAELIQQQILPKSENGLSTAFVPGCGRGYDAVALAEAGYTVLGLDLAPTAVEAANRYLEEMNGIQNPEGACSFEEGDFFGVSQRFDVIFDYTFLCALPPELRKPWAEKMKSSLKPGGELITLIFPICEKEGGPPYAMSMELVRDLCEGAGLEAVGPVGLLPPELCNRGRDGGPGSMFGASSALGRWRLAASPSN
mmetsp:Transcript_22379/g.35484  ORF Transcript_22379/g.35484 Transcript_22379/m.35484 type:complete len:264 (-) Transcript_22379:377-1168(-)